MNRILFFRALCLLALALLLTLALVARAQAANCDPAPTNLVAWWAGDGNANTLVGTNNGTLQGGATATAAGFVGQAFTFSGTNQYVQIPDAAVLRPTNFTIEAWVQFSSLNSPAIGGSAAGDQYIIFKQNTRTYDFEGIDISKTRVSGGDVFRFLVTSSAGVAVQINSATKISTNTWYHIAAVRGPSITQFYVNGNLEAQTNVTFAQNYGTLPLFFGTSGTTYWDHKLAGQLDEVSLYNRALNSNEIAAIFAAGSAGKCKGATPPSITVAPTNQTVAVGSNALFTVTATGTAPLSYQWQVGSTAITGATTSSLALTNVQTTDAGNYTVTITNLAGSTNSSATLTVLTPPSITLQPVGLTNGLGTTATFTATASGSPTLTYQWQFNGVNLTNNARITGVTTTNLTITSLVATDSGNYTLIARNPVGTATSSPAPLSVLAPPVVTIAPTSRTVAVGANPVFTVTATGTAPLNYQWQVGSTAITGATTSSLALTNVQTTDAGTYTVTITNLIGSTNSSATLTVLTPPGIAQQPVSTTNNLGGSASFTAIASGSPTLVYQWRLNGTNLVNGARITGATSQTLNLTGLLLSDAGNYTLFVSNSVGNTTSAPASLTVLSPPSITGQPANQTNLAGVNVSFNVTASGTQPLSFQWYRNSSPLTDGGNVSGSLSSTLSLSSISTNDAANYQVIVTNIVGAATSSVATLTVTVQGSCQLPPTGLVGWWPAEGNANDIAYVDNGSLQGGATATATGMVGQAFSFNGTNSSVQIPDSPTLDQSNLTIEAWVLFRSLNSVGSGGSPAGQQYIIFKQNTRNSDFEGYYLGKERNASGNDYFDFVVTSAADQSAAVASPANIVTNTWYHIAGVRGSNYIQLYVNGALIGQAAAAWPQSYGSLPLFFGSSGQSFWDHKLNGSLDEVSLYNRALSASEIASIYNARAGGKCKGEVPPTIMAQPVGATLVTGGTVSFSVGAAGSAPLGYQWYKDGSKLQNVNEFSGVTTATLVVSNLSSADIGNYQVTVANAFGSATSMVASLNSGVAPANDNFANAIALGTGSSGSVAGNNANATKQAGEPNHAGNPGGPSVWYTWKAASTSPVTFDTCISGFDTLLAVYTGNSVSSLSLVSSNNDISTNNPRSRLTFTPVNGTTYYIAVDGANGANGNFTLRWAQASVALPDLSLVASAVNPQISTENFAPNSCAVLEGLIQAGTRTIIRFDTETENSGTADLFFGNPANNPLFVWAPCHAHYHFNNYMSYRLRGPNGQIAATGLKVGFCVLDVFRWSSSGKNNATYNCNNQGISVGWGDLYDSTLDGQWIDITGLPPGNYTMELEANPQGIIQESNYTNNLITVPITIGNPSAPPDNDNFASAQALLGGFESTSGNTANATKEAGEPNHAGNPGGHSVWYQWQSPDTKPVTIDTIGSSFNTLLAVYTGSSLGGLNLVASNDDIGAGNLQSRVTFNATANTVYDIAVDGYNGASGNLVLTLDQTIQNDNFANPQYIGGVNGIAYGANVGATKEAGEPNTAGNPGGASIWYYWTAPITGTATFTTEGSSFNTLLGIYTGNSVTTLTNIASNDDVNPPTDLTSSVTFNATGLQGYHIAIDGYNGATGDTTLNWTLSASGASPNAVIRNLAAVSQPGGAVVSSTFMPEGEFQLKITGQPNQLYRVETSCDLTHWKAGVSTLADTDGNAYFTDKTTMNSGAQSVGADPVCGSGNTIGAHGRFYRAVAILPSN